MTLPEIITLGATILTLGAYWAVALRTGREATTLDGFLYYSRTLGSTGYSRTFVATGISLATVLAFFLDFGGQFGLALVLSPLMFLAGVVLLLRALPAMDQDGFIGRGTTLHAYLGSSFRSDAVRLITASVSVIGYIGILVIELFVGVQIAQLFSTDRLFLLMVVVALVMSVGIYTYHGGFRAVVATDQIQLLLILSATIVSLAFLVYVNLSNDTMPALNHFNPAPWRLPTSLLVVIVVGNIPLQIARMSNWQRIAAVRDLKSVQRGLRRAIGATLAFWLAFNVMGILLASSGQASDVSFGALRLLRVFQDTGGVPALVFLPLLFVGLLAALISTADSILIPLVTAWLYDFKYHNELNPGVDSATVSLQRSHELLATARRSVPMFLAVALAIYAILVWYARFDFVSLLFVFFNQQLVLFPIVVAALSPRKDDLPSASTHMSIGVVLGWAAVWISTWLGVQTGTQSLVFYAAPIGLGLSLAWTIARRMPREAFFDGLVRIAKGAR